MYTIWKYFEKGQVIAIIARNKLLEKALYVESKSGWII